MKQPAVAKLEKRADIYISSLGSYIESVGDNCASSRRSRRRMSLLPTSPAWWTGKLPQRQTPEAYESAR